MTRRHLLALLAALPGGAAVRGDKAAYVGGTVKTIKEGQQGILNLDDKTDLLFAYDNGEHRIPYSRITSMEFGQKVGRRVGATVALGVTTLGLAALPMLFSKKKKHYLTLGYTNATGENEAVILELSKGIVRTTIPVLEARTGQRVEVEGAPGEPKEAASGTAAPKETAPPVTRNGGTEPLQPTSAAASPTVAGPVAYFAKDRGSYHITNRCMYAGVNPTRMTEQEAVKRGGTRCKICWPE